MRPELTLTINQPPNNQPDLWDDFWTLYPRHEAKKDAMRCWSKLAEAQRRQAVIAIADWRQVWKAQGRDVSKIPLPATWLNGERWEDEVPEGIITARHASHAPAIIVGSTPKPADLPARVQSLLAVIRGKTGT